MLKRNANINIRLWITLGFVMILAMFLVFSSYNNLMITSAETAVHPDKLEFNRKGELIRPSPDNYRTWVFVGTPVTPNELNNGKAAFPEFHNVYIHPSDYKYYKTTGKFQDGTVLIKELVSVGAKKASSGNGYFQGEFLGLEATIKDSVRFPKEPGNWAYFSWSTKDHKSLKDTAKAFPSSSCNACHAANADDDFVFTQYYPVLRDANPKSKMKVKSMKTDKKMSITSNVKFDVPIEKGKLFKYLQAGKYKNFKKERSIHRSVGPHENVRVFINPTLEKSMKAANKNHPVGSASVKEMYKDNKPFGWAVMVKTESGNGGNGWYWYEVTSTTDSSKIFAEGNGATSCVGCHAPGNDYVITKFE